MPGQVDALEKMLKVIAAVKKMKMTCEPWSKVPGSPFIYCGALRAGRGRDHSELSPYLNIDFCTATFHIFTVPGQTPEVVLNDITQTIERLRLDDPDIMYELEMDPPEKVMPPMDLPSDSPIVEIVSNAYTRLTAKKVQSIGLADSIVGENGPACPPITATSMPSAYRASTSVQTVVGCMNLASITISSSTSTRWCSPRSSMPPPLSMPAVLRIVGLLRAPERGDRNPFMGPPSYDQGLETRSTSR